MRSTRRPMQTAEAQTAERQADADLKAAGKTK